MNLITTNIVIKACCELKQTDKLGFAVLGYAYKNSLAPNVITYSTLLNGLIGEGKLVEADELVKKVIRNKLWQVDIVFFNTVMKGLCMFPHHPKAISDLFSVIEKETDCKPDNVTYNIVFDSLCKHEMIDEALQLFSSMALSKGIPPDVVSYNILIDGLCHSERWKDVQYMLNDMNYCGVSPDVRTYSIFIKTYCRQGKTKHALSILGIMFKKAIHPDPMTYHPIIYECCYQGDLTNALNVFNLMKAVGVAPDIMCYDTLLNGYLMQGLVKQATRLFREITHRQHMHPKIMTYNTMIHGLYRAGHFKHANDLFLRMQSENIIPDKTTFKIVLQGLCDNNLFDQAFRLFKSLVDEKKVTLDVEFYNIMIHGKIS